jgi:hypothetical protein
MHFRRVLTVGVALACVGGLVPISAQQRNNSQQKPPQRSKAEQQDIETLVRLVDGVATGQPAPTDIPITWESNHFVKGQGGITYIPYTLSIDRAKLSSRSVAMYVRMVDKKQASQPAAPAPAPTKDGSNKNQRNDKDKGDQPAAPAPRPTFAWDNLQFIEIPAEGKLSRAVALMPGEYDAYITIKEKGTDQKNAPPAKMGVLHRELNVPDFNVPALTTSSVILATSVEPQTTALSPTQQEENPYVFGPMKIVPSPDGKFMKSAELQVVFWIYGAAEGTGGKPDVQVEYNFYQRPADGAEKYFNKTAPQQLNAQTLPPEFSVAAGHQLPGSLVVPLTSFPSGEYRLEIKVTDKPSGKTITQNVNFTVLAS